MIQVAPNRSQNGLIALAVVGIALVVVLATYRPLPAEPAATAGASPIAVATSSASPPTPTVAPTRTPSRTPLPTITGDSCRLPASLPQPGAAGTPVAAPRVVGTRQTLFAAPLYARGPLGFVPMDDLYHIWEMGLWLSEPSSNDARLLLTPIAGAVLPLAVSPDGTQAAIWWLPQRRQRSAATCESAIYVYSLRDGSSRILVRGDWTTANSDEDSGNVTGIFWQDPPYDESSSRQYSIPHVSWSPDGKVIAIVEGGAVWFLRGDGPYPYRHEGTCTDWAWAPSGATFVAGCDRMTSAWFVNVGEGDAPDSYALPLPAHEGWAGDWQRDELATIGIDSDGRIVVARFFGIATGCESPDCTIPDPGVSVTTIARGTGQASHQVKVLPFIPPYDGDGTHMPAGATWVHSAGEEGVAGQILDIATLDLRDAEGLGEYVGEAADGSMLYGAEGDQDFGGVVLFAIDATGRRTQLATVSHPDGAASTYPVFDLYRAIVLEPTG